MDYIAIKEASEKWNIGADLISTYCTEGRIDGAINRGNQWLISKNTSRPSDFKE